MQFSNQDTKDNLPVATTPLFQVVRTAASIVASQQPSDYGPQGTSTACAHRFAGASSTFGSLVVLWA